MPYNFNSIFQNKKQ